MINVLLRVRCSSSPVWTVIVYSNAGFDLSPSAIGQLPSFPVQERKEEKLCHSCHRRWSKMPEVKKVIYCSLTFTAWKSFTWTVIQTCLVQANCFCFPLVSYISFDLNLTRKIKKNETSWKLDKVINGPWENRTFLDVPKLRY